MLTKPDYDILLERIGSKYKLCVVASKRAMQLIDNFANSREGKSLNYRNPMVDFMGKNPLHVALEEISEGLVIPSIEAEAESREKKGEAELEAEKARKEIEDIFGDTLSDLEASEES